MLPDNSSTSPWPSLLLPLHEDASCCLALARILLTLLCWWQSAILIIPPIWHSGGDMHCCLPGWHFGVHVKAPPKGQPGKDWACVPPGERVPSPRPVHHHWAINKVVVPTWSDPEWLTVIFRKYHKSSPILSSPPLHYQKDLLLPHQGGSPGADPGACHLPPGVLQLPPCWSLCVCHEMSAANSECCFLPGIQPSQVFSHHCFSPLTVLVPCCCLIPVQNSGGEENHSFLPRGQPLRRGLTIALLCLCTFSHAITQITLYWLILVKAFLCEIRTAESPFQTTTQQSLLALTYVLFLKNTSEHMLVLIVSCFWQKYLPNECKVILPYCWP